MQTVDIAVIGAGPVGLAFARTLAGSGLSVTLIDQQSREHLADPAFDGREIALTHASRALLETGGLWQHVSPDAISPLRDARVMDGHSPFSLTFASAARQAGDLGWLVPNHLIRRAAWQAVQAQPGLEIRCGTSVRALQHTPTRVCVELADGARLSARLLVAADSRFSSTRRLLGIGAQLRDFGKTMLVFRMRHAVPHHHAAWEWFGYGKTLALLPLQGNRAGAVLTLPPRQVEALLAMDARAFGAAVTDAFEHRLGPMQQDGSRHAYPLIATYAQQFSGERAALIGDAAVGMHPVTAHGFNFGLQSQARLAERVLAAAARGGDIGAAAVVQGYARAHRLATRPLYEATNALAALYTDDRAPARLLRRGALRAANAVAPFKQAIAAHLTQRSV
ncbi:ubiquinone biosynthesis UbiH/UbiF/VisC/COQ6 family hydroxylase [Xanthomonas arboricola]|uniref:5-demethoxyubiquinol-8 5-hydroxylase UbiM n=1 Tax=Xanthomonas campestris TaxID=339 RepID=UPI0023E9D7EC|nr:ubiquinone biosynthesis UbiH/UbiF/VisC/COQ6 family hydroxylase [Xanthomonas campestris]MCW2007169.1 ubiquinone biosynthesis UbiH/UbiF/VisC/COQ6 family hydroxylase [Xanthomonas campestris]